MDFSSEIYAVESARSARSKILQLDAGKLSEPYVVELPYPGTGYAPPRPGGDLKIVGRYVLSDLRKAFQYVRAHEGLGSIIYLSGPIGSGKSCLLRSFACSLFVDVAAELAEPAPAPAPAPASSSSSSGTVRKRRRIVCLWNLKVAVNQLVSELKAALRFTYDDDEDVLAVIDGLESKDGVNNFIDVRKAMQDEFYFILDGAEAMDCVSSSGAVLSDSGKRTELAAYMLNLVQKGRLSIIGLSPMAEKLNRKRKAEVNWIELNDGLINEEYSVYAKELSVLYRVCNTVKRYQDLVYYAGGHPLSLAVFDRCCRMHAERKNNAGVNLNLFHIPEQLTDDQVVEEMAEEEDWEEVLELFVGSADIRSIRILFQEQLKKHGLREEHHDMMKMLGLDSRYVYGDPVDKRSRAEYVTPYIERIYTEEVRDEERKSVFQAGAWLQYCRYLLDRRMSVNWSQMGWICEDLASEIISLKGCKLDDLIIRRAQEERFGAVPDYKSWSKEMLQVGAAIFFIPMKYNYGSIDGIVVCNIEGVLHFVVIQITVNVQRHEHSAVEFMTHQMVSKWIPAQNQSDWKLHFVFICCKSSQPLDVQENLRTHQSGVTFGTVGYKLQKVSFQDAFGCLVEAQVWKTLKDIAERRDDAFKIDAPVPTPVLETLYPQGEADIVKLLSTKHFTKPELAKIAGHFGIRVERAYTKEAIRKKIMEKIMGNKEQTF